MTKWKIWSLWFIHKGVETLLDLLYVSLFVCLSVFPSFIKFGGKLIAAYVSCIFCSPVVCYFNSTIGSRPLLHPFNPGLPRLHLAGLCEHRVLQILMVYHRFPTTVFFCGRLHFQTHRCEISRIIITKNGNP